MVIKKKKTTKLTDQSEHCIKCHKLYADRDGDMHIYIFIVSARARWQCPSKAMTLTDLPFSFFRFLLHFGRAEETWEKQFEVNSKLICISSQFVQFVYAITKSRKL